MKIDYDFNIHPWQLNLLVIITLVICALLWLAFISLLFMGIWNITIPALFNLSAITFRQSVDILMLIWLARKFSEVTFNRE